MLVYDWLCFTALFHPLVACSKLLSEKARGLCDGKNSCEMPITTVNDLNSQPTSLSNKENLSVCAIHFSYYLSLEMHLLYGHRDSWSLNG